MKSEAKQNPIGLNTDSVTIQTLRDFLASEKPASMKPVDVLGIIQLILRKAEDHPIFDSQETLAKAFCCDKKTIVRSQQRLAKLKWLDRPQRRGRTNALSLNSENIPSEKALRSLVTDDAKKISVAYWRELKKRGRKRFSKSWLSRQHLSAQRILDRCGGDLRLVGKMMGHAFGTAGHKTKAMKSLYELHGRWKKVEQTYYAKLQAQQPQVPKEPESIEQTVTQTEVAP